MLDPRTLETAGRCPLPPRDARSNPFNDFTGGGYFYLDHRDRAVIPTSSATSGVGDADSGPPSRSSATTTSAA